VLKVLVDCSLLSSIALLAHGGETTLGLRGLAVHGNVEISIALVVLLF
jgi:hypothetical protein